MGKLKQIATVMDKKLVGIEKSAGLPKKFKVSRVIISKRVFI